MVLNDVADIVINSMLQIVNNDFIGYLFIGTKLHNRLTKTANFTPVMTLLTHCKSIIYFPSESEWKMLKFL